MTVRPPPRPPCTSTLARAGPSSSTSTRSPCASAHSATTRTAGASPEPVRSSDGLTDSVRTSAVVSSSISRTLTRATLQRLCPDVPVRAGVRDAKELVRRQPEALDHPPRDARVLVVGELAAAVVVEAPHREVALRAFGERCNRARSLEGSEGLPLVAFAVDR